MTKMKTNVGPTLLTVGKKAVTDYRIPLLAVLLFVVMAILKPNFASAYNIYTITDSAAKSGIAAIGFTFILLVGQLDISFGSVISLTACVFMMMLKAGMGFGLAVVAALIVGMACGTLTGFFVANFRLSPFIVSMTMQLVYKGIALTITKSTPVAMTHPVLKAINSVKLLDMIPMTFLFFLVLVALSEFVLRKTQFGRNIFLVVATSAYLTTWVLSPAVMYGAHISFRACSQLWPVLQ